MNMMKKMMEYKSKGEISNLSFEEGNGRSLPLEDQSLDVVVVHTTMCHVPDPEGLVAEGFSWEISVKSFIAKHSSPTNLEQ